MSESRRQRAAPRGRPFFWVLVVAAIAAAVWWWPRTRTTQPNVLLITIDTLRADVLTEDDTPAILELADRGTRFSRVRAPTPITLPSHTTLLSGLWPTRHRIRDNTSPPLPTERGFPLLAEQFAAAGYDTAAFVASAVLGKRYGLDAGFGEYREPAAQDKAAPEFRSLDGTEQVARFKAWWEARDTTRPYFAWVHLWEPHAPYRAYAGDGRRSGTVDTDPARERYLGEVRKADAMVEAILALIDADTTIVVLTSDHGESLGENGEDTHAYLCRAPTMNVPLIVAGPGIDRAVSVDRPAALTDVAPTLRRIAGLDAVATDGKDLFDLPRKRAIPGESLYAFRRYRWAQQTVAFDGQFTLVDGGAVWGLYDGTEPVADAEQHPAFEELDSFLARYRASGSGGASGAQLTLAGSPYGAVTIPDATLLPPAENRKLKPMSEGWKAVKLLARAEGALALALGGGRRIPIYDLQRDLRDLERNDPTNPAPCLIRGRALLFVFDKPAEAVEAFEEAQRRGYTGPAVAKLLAAARGR